MGESEVIFFLERDVILLTMLPDVIFVPFSLIFASGVSPTLHGLVMGLALVLRAGFGELCL